MRKQASCSGGQCVPNGCVPPTHEVTRYVAEHIQRMLWGRAAGRCEFEGCNKPLWKSAITQEQVNIADKAHIYSFSSNGPRGHDGVSKEDLNSLGNLFLVCHDCHRKIDAKKDGGRYTAERLQGMKALHEQRIELVTGIAAHKKSQILLYGANVGDHSSPLTYNEAAPALFPERYPSSDTAVELSMINSSYSDRDAEFWTIEAENLQRKFKQRVREKLAVGDIEHLSVFAVAPQPLLILLGSLLGDIVPADIYQRHREPAPPTWAWPKAVLAQGFEVRTPTTIGGTPALVMALSGTITHDRIASVLGANTSIWTVAVQNPHNEVTKSREQLSQLRSLLRRLLDEIKAIHGQTTLLHVFPAMSVSTAIELGRVRMPKADMAWQLYDQLNTRGGFIPALSIPSGAW